MPKNPEGCASTAAMPKVGIGRCVLSFKRRGGGSSNEGVDEAVDDTDSEGEIEAEESGVGSSR